MVKHCCERMNQQIENRCDQHPHLFDCPDALIYYDPKFEEYGLIVHDDSRSHITIDFCPFCGMKLPEAR